MHLPYRRVVALFAIMFMAALLLGGEAQAILSKFKRETSIHTSDAHGAKVTIEVEKYSVVTAQFDLCNVIDCGSNEEGWWGYDVYMCIFQWGIPANNPWCPNWSYVYWNSRPTGYVYNPTSGPSRDFQSKIKLIRGQATWPAKSGKRQKNPLILTIRDLAAHPFKQPNGKQQGDSFYLIIGVDVAGKDPKGLIKITFVEPKQPAVNLLPTSITPAKSNIVQYHDLSSPEQVLKLETGYADKNLWLDWITYTAQQQNMVDCVACSSARPTLYTTPAPLLYHTDRPGFDCMLKMHMEPNPANCTTLSALFPLAPNNTIPPVFTPKSGKYVCLEKQGTIKLGHVPLAWCNLTLNVTTWSNMSGLVYSRADLFWYCGGKILHNNLPRRWDGTCTLVRLALPVTLLGSLEVRKPSHPSRRRKRAADAFDLTKNSPTYFDTIGVPRGVPDEYKLGDQVAGGFESIFIWVTPNKNLDRINYIHFNVQRLANLTRDAVGGLSEQLASTSLMTVQNRMALDMLLAEKGGVCSMFGSLCCTFIPNNTAPDGSVTRALKGLRTLANQMAEDSGIENPIFDWWNKTFGKYQALVASLFISIAVFVSILTCCGCCLIPCLRTLITRLITTALSKESSPPPYQMPLLQKRENKFVDGDKDQNDKL